jgi:hypothetical protein
VKASWGCVKASWNCVKANWNYVKPSWILRESEPQLCTWNEEPKKIFFYDTPAANQTFGVPLTWVKGVENKDDCKLASLSFKLQISDSVTGNEHFFINTWTKFIDTWKQNLCWIQLTSAKVEE